MMLRLQFLILLLRMQLAGALQFPKIPQFFQTNAEEIVSGKTRQERESLLTESISNTQFGKTATPSQQRDVLSQVLALETEFPSPPLKDILGSGDIDGTWYLQFTSPSEIEDAAEKEPGWKVENPEEKITTKKFNAKGSVSAAGINVDVSNKPPKQIFDLTQNKVFNEVTLPKAFVRVGGPFRLSEKNEKRAVVSFKEGFIDLNFFKFDVGFLFSIIALIKGTDELGWLETTYLSENVRIGRGNKGSMFVLTRDESAVAP